MKKKTNFMKKKKFYEKKIKFMKKKFKKKKPVSKPAKPIPDRPDEKKTLVNEFFSNLRKIIFVVTQNYFLKTCFEAKKK